MRVRRNRHHISNSSRGNLRPKVPPISHPISLVLSPKGLLARQAGLEVRQEDLVLVFRIVLGLRVVFLVVLVALALSRDHNTECPLTEHHQAGILAQVSISPRGLSPLICPWVRQDSPP